MSDISVKLKPRQSIKVKNKNVYVFDPDVVQEYVDLAEDWATKTDGLVDSTDYSAKAYAVGGTGTRTNNAKYYAGQAATSAADAKRWATGYPSEPDGYSAKYWADEAAAAVENMANKDLSNLSATGEAKFDAAGAASTAETNAKNYADATFVPQTRKINNKALSADITLSAGDVGALPSSAKYGASLSLSINSSTFVITAQLKDQNGNSLGSAQTIDLPLESVVVSGSYDDETKKVILTLQNGSTVEFSVADLVSGLQSEITSTNKLDADLVDDSTSANKFVTSSEKSAISSALQPNDNISELNNNAGYVKDTDLPTVNNATINITQGGVIKGSFTLNQASDGTIALDAGGSVKTFDLFDHKWSDYQLDDQSWLRADTFSWQDGTVYSDAYNHLVAEYNSATASSTTYYAWYNSVDGTYYTLSPNVSVGDDVYVYYNNEFIATETVQSVETGYIIVRIGGGAPRALDRDSTKDIQVSSALQTETIAGTTITYYLVEDGHKIILPDQENNAVTIYNATGVAWYYILDTANQRFKLPRENPAREELIQTIRAKGDGKSIGLTNGTDDIIPTTYTNGLAYFSKGTQLNIGDTVTAVNPTSLKAYGVNINSTKSGIISSMTDSTSVYKGKKYLYFYVGQFSQSATEQTAGLNAELFNGKVDLNLNNMNPSASAKETIVGWGMPDYTAGVNKGWASFTAESKGWLYCYAQVASQRVYVYVNGAEVYSVYNNQYADGKGELFPIDEGDIVTISGTTYQTAYMIFYPCKGL